MKMNNKSGFGDEYDTVMDLALSLEKVKNQRRYTLVDLKSGKRKIVNSFAWNVTTAKITWKIWVRGDNEEDIMTYVMKALRASKNYKVNNGNNRPRYISNLADLVGYRHFIKVSKALKKTGRVRCYDRVNGNFIIELLVPKWTGWTIKDVYGLSGETINIRMRRHTSVLQIDKETGEIIRKWNSIIEIVRELGLNGGALSRCCNGGLKSTGGFKWKYAD